jgi:RNA:NAD 2'-phosphotransferase (TPT1/KptA family)
MTPNSVGERNERLYHGTQLSSLDSILATGLDPARSRDPQLPAICLTEGIEQARISAWRAPEHGVVLTVDVTGLPLLRLGFVTCFVWIEPDRVVEYVIVERP